MLLVHAFNQSTQEAVADSSVNLTIAKKGPRTALSVIQGLHDLKNKIKNKKNRRNHCSKNVWSTQDDTVNAHLTDQ